VSDDRRRNAPFVRPANNLLDRIFNQFLPPQPIGQLEYNTPKALRATPRDYLTVLGQILLILLVGGVQIWLAHWTSQPPVVLLVHLFWKLKPLMGTNFQILRWIVVVAICGYFLYAIRRDSQWSQLNLSAYRWHWPLALWVMIVDNSTRSATIEEQWYREGAESWKPRQRLTANLIFGFSHITTIFYPVASYLPLCLLGYTLNQVYLQELQQTHNQDLALERAIVVHRLSNWMRIVLVIPYFAALVLLA
jgi:hypothetical protein